MLSNYSLLIAECDEPEEFDDCWGESVVQFELHEDPDDALALLIASGWTITEKGEGYTCICPYCGEDQIKKVVLKEVKKGG